MKAFVACTFIALIAFSFFENAEALDCRSIRYNVVCPAVGTTATCASWCKAFTWTGGTCITIPAGTSCPGKAAGSRACYCS
ncbi:hypothetical protein AAVH_13562 [Aphelenchoides avenae]|nr:hypothetical protein AAVH_13562 [Aphelenchus avenae]